MKAVAKCQQQDAPELELPPYRSMYKFVNTLISSADQMDQQKLQQVFGSQAYQTNFMRYKMQKMMQHIMNEENHEFNVRPYSFDNKMDKFDMMKDIIMKNQYSEQVDKYEMVKMMKEFFGKDHSSDKYEYGQYEPQQARFRFRRQATGSTKPNQGLDIGDRLFAKLEEQKKDMEFYVGNMTCVLRETNVLNKENELDVQAMKKSLQQYTMPSPWFKNKYEELIDICYETAVNIPAPIEDQYKVEGDFGKVNLAQIKLFTKCSKERNQNIWVSCRSLAIGIILNRHCLFNV